MQGGACPPVPGPLYRIPLNFVISLIFPISLAGIVPEGLKGKILHLCKKVGV